MSAARSFLDSLAGYTDAPGDVVPSQDKPAKLGTVDAGYTGTGRPMVLFDGESLMGVRTYAWTGRKPRAGERVMLSPVGRGYVIAAVDVQADPTYSQLFGLDLDGVLTLGVYEQGSGTNGTLVRNYPEASSAGVLEVYGTDNHYLQRFTSRSGARVWTRSKYTTGAWGAWSLISQRGLDGIPYATAAGTAAGVTVASTAVSRVTVTFPAGRFSVTPIIVVGMLTDARDTNAYVETPTATNFVLCRGSNSTLSRANLAAYWTATQMTASSAAG